MTGITTALSRSSLTAAWLPNLMLLAVAVVWGTSYGVAKGALLLYPVLGFLAIRFLITCTLLLPALHKAGWAEARATFKIGLPLGIVLLSIFVCETFGLTKTSAANAAFLISLCVVFTPFTQWAILRLRPTWSDFIATFVSLLGAFLLSTTVTLSFNAGDALILVAALLRAYMVTLTKKRTAGKSVDLLSLTAVQTGTVGLGCLLLALFTLPGGLPPLSGDLHFWYATAYLVVFCTIFAFFVQNYAVRHTTPTRVHLLMGMEPVFGALFAVVWLNEKLTPLAWLGGLLIVAAPLWVSLQPLLSGQSARDAHH